MEPAAQEDRDLARATALVRWLDGRYLDPIIGLLLPEVGDLFTAIAGLYLVVVAVRRKARAVVIARMLLNLGIDALLGAVPGIGDLADFFYRANTRNLALLQERSSGRPARFTDWLAVGGAALFLIGTLLLPWVLLVWLLTWFVDGLR